MTHTPSTIDYVREVLRGQNYVTRSSRDELERGLRLLIEASNRMLNQLDANGRTDDLATNLAARAAEICQYQAAHKAALASEENLKWILTRAEQEEKEVTNV